MRLIDADAVPQEFWEYEFDGKWRGCTIKDLLDSQPTADAVPVVHAYWIPQKENYEFKEAWMKCSACGYPVSRWTGNTNFCPHCGAKMDGKRGDEAGWLKER